MAVSREARIEAVKLLIAEGWNPPRPSDAVLDWILDDMERVDWKATLSLSPAEKHVLALAAEGYSTQESADMRGVSYETIKNQRADALRRLGARNTTHAVAICLRNGGLAA